MRVEKLTKKELQQLFISDGILLERIDRITNTAFYIPNMEKIGIMIRELDFLTDASSRGKAINEISKIELYLYENEDKPDLQKDLLAMYYSKTSIFLELKKELIADKNSENWNSIFMQYFSLEDIYDYFHKTEGASNFFRKFKIYEELVELSYNIKLMDYLQGQIELFIPLDDDKKTSYKIDSLEMIILIFEKTGFLESIKKRMKDDYYENGAKLINSILGKPTANWKQINEILVDIDHNPESSIMADEALRDRLRDILFHYKIDLR